MDATQKLVIGAGMVGSCCALYLQRAGHSVTLVDPHPPGSQTSFGYAAAIAPYACIPVNHPKLLTSLPALMFGAERPLSISPGYALTMLPLLQTSARIINIDETWVSTTQFTRQHWCPTSKPSTVAFKEVTPRISLICALDNNGRVYYSQT